MAAIGAYAVETCAWCCGAGKENDDLQCRVCRGRGAVLVARPSQKCKACHCTGRVYVSAMRACRGCGGAGWEGVRPSGTDRRLSPVRV